jgi:hypothetical protein
MCLRTRSTGIFWKPGGAIAVDEPAIGAGRGVSATRSFARASSEGLTGNHANIDDRAAQIRFPEEERRPSHTWTRGR